MKTMKLFLVFFVAAFWFQILSAQVTNLKSETLKVSGNCEMCKTRIEAAVSSAGAINPSWDVKTKILSFSFDPSKLSADLFSKAVAAAGHDTEKYRADDKVYNALPACCKYERVNFQNSAGSLNHRNPSEESHN